MLERLKRLCWDVTITKKTIAVPVKLCKDCSISQEALVTAINLQVANAYINLQERILLYKEHPPLPLHRV